MRSKELARFVAVTTVAMQVLLVGDPGVLLPKPSEKKPVVATKNVTATRDQLEVKPRFIEHGQSILYLEFTGDPHAPHPWDYRLRKTDREGLSSSVLTSRGVLDYNVLSDDRGVLVLKALTAERSAADEMRKPLQGWELWYLNTQDEEMVLIEASTELPLAIGYRMLGMAIMRAPTGDAWRVVSPRQENALMIRRVREPAGFRLIFYHVVDESELREVFSTPCWYPHTDHEWFPGVTWLSEHAFVTLAFTQSDVSRLPGLDGRFAIVKIDLKTNQRHILYESEAIRARENLVLDPGGEVLYFQKQGETHDTTEIWRLHVRTGVAEMVYQVFGTVGSITFTPDGRSLVFTQLHEDNLDVIRVDLENYAPQRIVGK